MANDAKLAAACMGDIALHICVAQHLCGTSITAKQHQTNMQANQAVVQAGLSRTVEDAATGVKQSPVQCWPADCCRILGCPQSQTQRPHCIHGKPLLTAGTPRFVAVEMTL